MPKEILEQVPSADPEIEVAEKDEDQPSPFLPGTKIQYAFDSTSLEWLKRCPRLYQYNMIENWRPLNMSVHLRFGIEYHQAHHNYDKARALGIDHEDALYDVVRDMVISTADWVSEDKYKNRFTLFRTVIWYLDQFRDDPADTIIQADKLPACEVNFKFELDWGPMQKYHNGMDDVMGQGGLSKAQPYILCGYLDRVVDFQGESFVMDYKTTKSTPGAYFFNQFEPNNQMTLYTIAGQIIFGGTIKGVIIDSAQVTIEFSRFTRGLTYRTKDQITEWLNDLKYWLSMAEQYAIQGYWPQNDTACDKYGGCVFREVCSKSPNVREVYLKSNFIKGDPWNPLLARD